MAKGIKQGEESKKQGKWHNRRVKQRFLIQLVTHLHIQHDEEIARAAHPKTSEKG